MELYAFIKNRNYAVNFGAPVIENMGDELDSASVVISHVEKIAIKPFDDIFIHANGREWVPEHKNGELVSSPNFYKHFVVYNYNKTQVNQQSGLFNYSIDCVSETKYLEKVLMPNRTITNPLNKRGKTVAELANIFVGRYSPRIKITSGDGKWHRESKFVVSGFENPEFAEKNKEIARKYRLKTVRSVFGDVEAYETFFTNPNLREVLSSLFNSCNCIPVVKDGVIFCCDLSEKWDKVDEIPGQTWVNSMMNGDSYVDRLRKNYSNGMTEKNAVKSHEYLSFRNVNAASMRFQDLTLETRFPIYKINKFALCYYSSVNGNAVKKIDLTSFVLPNSTRALLSNDWMFFNSHVPTTINGYELSDGYHLGICDYRFMTVGYDIGSNVISGFGEFNRFTNDGLTYEHRCVLENVFNMAFNLVLESAQSVPVSSEDLTFMFPTLSAPYYASRVKDIAMKPSEEQQYWLGSLISRIYEILETKDISIDENSLSLKSLFFEIEYQGLISSSVEVSKSAHDGDIMSIDNQLQSMALMDKDGEMSKIKADRLGNESTTIMARVGSIDKVLKIGDWHSDYGICYRVSSSFGKDYAAVTYSFCKDYVLANYFTSVNSKFRSQAYASQSQNVARNEVTSLQFLMSKDKMLKSDNFLFCKMEDIAKDLNVNFQYEINIKNMMWMFGKGKESAKTMCAYGALTPNINTNYYDESTDKSYHFFACDEARYQSGSAKCVTFGMVDSETAGTYIRQMFPDTSNLTKNILQSGVNQFNGALSSYAQYATKDSPFQDLTGTMQGWLTLPTSKSDGSVYGMTFLMCENACDVQKKIFEDDVYAGRRSVASVYEDGISLLPMLSDEIARNFYDFESKKPFVGDYFEIYEGYKDAKEVISETFEIEPISENNEIAFSSLLLNEQIARAKKSFIDGYEQRNILLFMGDEAYEHIGEYPNLGVHSLTVFGIEDDFSGVEMSKAVPITINKTIKLESNFTFSDPNYKQRDGEISIFFKTIDEVVPDRYIVATISFSGRFGKYVSGGNPDMHGDFTSGKYETFRSDGDIKIVMWDESYIRSTLNTSTPCFCDFSIPYNDFYGNDVNASFMKKAYINVKGKEMFSGSEQKRRAYVFNLFSFPKGKTLVKEFGQSEEKIAEDSYTGVWKNNPLITPMLMSGINNNGHDGHRIFDLLNLDDYSDFYKYSEDLTANAKYGKIVYIGEPDVPVAVKRQVVWLFSKNKMDGSFNKMESFDSLQTLLNSKNAQQMDVYYDEYNEDHVADPWIKLPIGGIRGDSMEVVGKEPQEGFGADNGSALLYYLDDKGIYRFVFGCNGEIVQASPGQLPHFYAKIYLSLVPDRSRTVYDADTMLPKYETANYAVQNFDYPNACVLKE